MFLNSETPEILFDIDLSQGFRYNGMGKGHRKGKHEEEVLVRTPELERRYTAPPSATQHNVTSYLFCLSLYLRKVIRPIEEQMVQLECFWKFSKFLTWVFRHSAQLLHTDLSLTLNELFWFNQFTKHMNTGLSYIQHRDYEHHPYYHLNLCDILSLLFVWCGFMTREDFQFQYNKTPKSDFHKHRSGKHHLRMKKKC